MGLGTEEIGGGEVQNRVRGSESVGHDKTPDFYRGEGVVEFLKQKKEREDWRTRTTGTPSTDNSGV